MRFRIQLYFSWPEELIHFDLEYIPESQAVIILVFHSAQVRKKCIGSGREVSGKDDSRPPFASPERFD